MRFQAIAGTSGDREAAIVERNKSADIAQKELPKLQAKIEALQKQTDMLERDARLSSKRVDEQSTAVDHLKKLCPQNLVESVRHSVTAIEHSIGQQLREFEGRSNELSCCLDKSRYETEESYLESLRRSFREAVEIIITGKYQTLSLSAQWPAIKADIESELANLRKNLEPLRLQYSAAIAAAELPLNFYV